jgi:hypothetical protein
VKHLIQALDTDRTQTPGGIPPKEHGQALAEFLALAVALVPLFLLVPMIAKYQDIAHHTQMASRYAAFDAITRNDSISTWKPEAQLADEVRRRFFSNTDAPIKTNDTAGDFKTNQNLFWRNPDDTAMIADFGRDVVVTYGPGNGASHNDGFTASSDGVWLLPPNAFGLESKGIYTANVSVALANVPDSLSAYRPFDALNLRIQRGTSVLYDAWSAKGPEQAEQRFGGNTAIFPAGAFSSMSAQIGVAVKSMDPMTASPKLGRLDFWRDVVPDDRLK